MASCSGDRKSLWLKIWILPEVSCRSMNMPLLRLARMRPATATRSSVVVLAGQLGIVALELGRLMGANEAIGIGIDTERPQRLQLLQPDPAELVIFV